MTKRHTIPTHASGTDSPSTERFMTRTAYATKTSDAAK